ncbi:hypothetical protein [Clostridium sp.]|uniref:hypothetical protein n=1 Tax=Clostridium sp. TaxID=1506 RepID=UPI003F38A6F2
MSERFIIPIKLGSYEEIFNEIDYREIEKRSVSDSVDSFIKNTYVEIPKDDFNVILKIYLPLEIKSEALEIKTIKGIHNYYKSFDSYEEIVMGIGIKRIIYYFALAIILLSLYYCVTKYIEISLIGEFLSAGGTVVLWQAMTLLLIERKNFKVKGLLNEKLSNIEIFFAYK